MAGTRIVEDVPVYQRRAYTQPSCPWEDPKREKSARSLTAVPRAGPHRQLWLQVSQARRGVKLGGGQVLITVNTCRMIQRWRCLLGELYMK